MAIFNTAKILTMPGADPVDPFCPPKGFRGGGDEYITLIQTRMTDKVHGSRLLCYARHAHHPEAVPVMIHGPYMKEVASILDSLKPTKKAS